MASTGKLRSKLTVAAGGIKSPGRWCAAVRRLRFGLGNPGNSRSAVDITRNLSDPRPKPEARHSGR